VDDKNFFRVDLDPKIQVTRKLAREFADAFIPLDGIFASNCIGVTPTLWAADGVHPTEAGARLIADYYADAFDKIFASMK
jgi:lysophospholipase L1-like esterase